MEPGPSKPGLLEICMLFQSITKAIQQAVSLHSSSTADLIMLYGHPQQRIKMSSSIDEDTSYSNPQSNIHLAHKILHTT